MAHKEWLTSKERVLRNYRFERIDRFSIDYGANSHLVNERLCSYYGVQTYEELLCCLHVDFRRPGPGWIGPELKDAQGRRTDTWGIPRAGVGDFGYALEHPLANVVSKAGIEAYPWPTIDMWDWDGYVENCRQHEQYAVSGGVWSWFLGVAADLVGMERLFIMLVDEKELAHALIDRIADHMAAISEIEFEKAGRYIDISFQADDLGTQRGPLLSRAMFDEYVRPGQQRIFDVAQRYGKPIMYHSCGSVVALIPALMEMGVSVLDPIQVQAAGMEPKALAARFGGRLGFHGSIDTQHTLPFGTPEDVRAEVRQRCEIFRPYGGFTIAPSQGLLPEVPTENIVAMYEAAWEFGWME
jgi:uroporphyrinogen decarboxylase